MNRYGLSQIIQEAINYKYKNKKTIINDKKRDF